MRPTPVFLPGNMCDARLWQGEGGLISRTLERHRMLEQVHADLTRDDSIAGMAARALAAAPGRLLPIGFSLGAIVAVEMAVQAPDRISGLALLGYNATADLAERAAHRPVQQAEVRRGGLERVLVEELKPNYLATRNRRDRVLLTLLRDMGMSLGPDVFLRQSEALRLRPDRRPMLSRLAVPVLLVCGAEDALCPPEWHEEWASLITHSEMIVVPDAGHMLPLEAPVPLSQALDQWLSQREFS